jgi:mRNA interferase RelE/StbE
LGVNEITWQTKALRQLRKLEQSDSSEIRLSVTKELPDFSTSLNVKKLTNHDYDFRLRVGHFRVFFNFDGKVQVVSIEEVKKRNERTY